MKKEHNQKAAKEDTAPKAQESLDELSKQADQEKKIKKPGSQSNHSKQHNNGRGGGK